MTLILDGVVLRGNAGLRVKANEAVGCARVGADRTIGKLQLQSERTKPDAIVRVQIEWNARVVSDETTFVAVLNATAVGTKRKPALRIDVEQTSHIEPITSRNAGRRELAFRLRNREIRPDRESRRNRLRVVDLRASGRCRRKKASCAQ